MGSRRPRATAVADARHRRVAPTVATVKDVLRHTYEQWRRDRTVRLGAGLAYYGLFALVPLLTLGVVLAGLVFSQEEVQAFVAQQLGDALGIDADAVATAIATRLDDASLSAGLGVIGAVSLLIAASFVFVALQDALNVIWHVPVRSGIRRTVREHLLAFGVVLAFVALLVVTLAVQSVLGLLSSLLPGHSELVRGALDAVASLALVTGAIAVLFRVLPRSEVEWRHALVGGVLTALLLSAGTWVISAYLERFAARSVTGAAGGVLLVLLWIYYEAQILLVGAELTKVLGWRTDGPS